MSSENTVFILWRYFLSLFFLLFPAWVSHKIWLDVGTKAEEWRSNLKKQTPVISNQHLTSIELSPGLLLILSKGTWEPEHGHRCTRGKNYSDGQERLCCMQQIRIRSALDSVLFALCCFLLLCSSPHVPKALLLWNDLFLLPFLSIYCWTPS